jgi:hypothetical protein
VKALKEWKRDCPDGAMGLVFPSGTGKVEFYANITKRWFYPAQLTAGVTTDTGEKGERSMLSAEEHPKKAVGGSVVGTKEEEKQNFRVRFLHTVSHK